MDINLASCHLRQAASLCKRDGEASNKPVVAIADQLAVALVDLRWRIAALVDARIYSILGVQRTRPAQADAATI
ncbi:hypothetical protein [Mesorhizobium helmanticense]|uniref:Uncharacterized protein n=1 Tax=Mesorhizobium helmanticense TaxID=1776423 RepID=A0A2T4IPT7_9HYPH|nr:hypothetical protein [Mesorhizobium helmanticense]PTE07671.1 hypothetical protein C9427_24805 [Mesorhizobium helmanticense]